MELGNEGGKEGLRQGEESPALLSEEPIAHSWLSYGANPGFKSIVGKSSFLSGNYSQKNIKFFINVQIYSSEDCCCVVYYFRLFSGWLRLH